MPGIDTSPSTIRPLGPPPPWVKTSAACALDGLVAAAAVVIAARPHPSPAARMGLLICAHRSGLLPTPGRDVLAELDALLGRIRTDPSAQRRILVRTMNLLVGGAWASLVLDAAEQIDRAAGEPDMAGRSALRAVSAALAWPGASGA